MLALTGCTGESTPRPHTSPDPDTSPVEITPARLAPDDHVLCRDLVRSLPETVADQTRRAVTPAVGTTAAWGDPAIRLTCGVEKPIGFNRFSVCTIVNDVEWYVPLDWPDEKEWPKGGELVITTVGTDPHVEVRIPGYYLPPAGIMAKLAEPISRALDIEARC